MILEELAMDDDSPDDVAHRAFCATCSPITRSAARPPASADTSKSITADDVREFFGERYRAGSMVVAVAGRLDHDEVLDRSTAAFAGVRDAMAASLAPTSAPGRPVARSIEDDTEQVHLVLGVQAIPRDDPRP